MKIAIDISQVIYGTGVSKYTDGLVRNLLKIDRENEYTLYGGSLRRFDEFFDYFSTLKGKYKKRVTPISPFLADLVWNRFRKIRIDKIVGSVDVFHSSDWVQPPTSAFKVTTVHDLYFLKHPQYVHPRIVKTHMKRLEIVKKEVDHIIVPSQSTKNDLVLEGFDEKKISVVPEAPASDMVKASGPQVYRIRKKYKIKKDYIVGIGINHRKNTKRIVEAYKKLRKEVDVDLVLVGRPTHIEVGETQGLIKTGFIPDDELAAIITGAKVLVFPSLYEGFGIPVLDSFICDTPVVASNTSSLPEVAGDAAVLVNPKSVDAIVTGIRKAITHEKELVARGRKELMKYSWERNARETLKIYNLAQ